MKRATKITCLFLDIGGVLLTDGWNEDARKRAAANFDLDFSAVEDRHRLVFSIYEEGKLSLQEYLGWTVFFEKRKFTRDQLRAFMFAQSAAEPRMIELICALKARYGLKIVVVSNEARELNAYRIRKFNLNGFVDAFVSSCFVGIRKPDPEIFQLSLDIAQVPVEQIIYVENTAVHVDVAEGLGIQSILHKDHDTTRANLAVFGLQDDASAKLTMPERQQRLESGHENTKEKFRARLGR